MLCATHACCTTRKSVSYASRLLVNRWQIRGKNDVFPIPPSFKLSKAARVGRQTQKQRPPLPRHGRSINPLRAKVRRVSAVLPLKLNASNFESINEEEKESRLTTLDNVVESHINRYVTRGFSFNSGKIILEHFKAPHPDLRDFMPAFVTRDEMRDDSLRLFWDALNDLLPLDPLAHRIESPKGKLFRRSLLRARPNADLEINRVPLHGHLTLFNHPIKPSQLLPDGTDNRFLPGPPHIWKHRLWAGGAITLNTHLPQSYGSGKIYHMVEKPVDMRLVGKDRPERVFIKVRKSFYSIDQTLPTKLYGTQEIFDFLGGRPKYGPSANPRNKNEVLKEGPFLDEEYTLCFLRDPPDLGRLPRKSSRPAFLNPKFTHILTPNRHLLFCWSALTYNAHLIHLDPNFARTEYGASDLLVHGPLTLYLVSEWFLRQLTVHAMNTQLSTFHVQSIEYKNHHPLYVDQPMKFCMKPAHSTEVPGKIAPKWTVWIEKDRKDGTPSIAFKAEIVVTSDYPQDHKVTGRRPGRWARDEEPFVEPVAEAASPPSTKTPDLEFKQDPKPVTTSEQAAQQQTSQSDKPKTRQSKTRQSKLRRRPGREAKLLKAVKEQGSQSSSENDLVTDRKPRKKSLTRKIKPSKHSPKKEPNPGTKEESKAESNEEIAFESPFFP